MAEQKHFSYEGHVTVKQPDYANAEVTGVEFLVPVRVKVKHKNGQEETINGQVNWAEQKAYFFNKPELDAALSANVFAYVTGKLAVPADLYAASEDIREEAGEVHSEFQNLYTQNVGDLDE
jgi:hypothetical protein